MRICRIPQAGAHGKNLLRKLTNDGNGLPRTRLNARSIQKPPQGVLRGFLYGAGDENRTHNRSLGSSYFATKLRPLVYFV